MRSPLLLGPALLAALTLSTLAPLCRADLAPPRGFVESCTMKAQSGAGKECLSCAAFYGNSDHCEVSLGDYGFTQGCRTGGASVWSEVWCRPAGPGAKPVPKEVLAQLDTAAGHPPAPAARPSAAPTGTLPIDPVSPAFVAPTAPPSAAPPAPTSAPIVDPPAPPPLPPTGGCGACATPRPETAIWAPLLALGALAVGWSRRRNRR
jgi:hypothetical protein